MERASTPPRRVISAIKEVIGRKMSIRKGTKQSLSLLGTSGVSSIESGLEVSFIVFASRRSKLGIVSDIRRTLVSNAGILNVTLSKLKSKESL